MTFLVGKVPMTFMNLAVRRIAVDLKFQVLWLLERASVRPIVAGSMAYNAPSDVL
jgi:hypothetical protein